MLSPYRLSQEQEWRVVTGILPPVGTTGVCEADAAPNTVLCQLRLSILPDTWEGQEISTLTVSKDKKTPLF